MVMFITSSILPSALRQEPTYLAEVMNIDAPPVKVGGARLGKVTSRGVRRIIDEVHLGYTVLAFYSRLFPVLHPLVHVQPTPVNYDRPFERPYSPPV